MYDRQGFKKTTRFGSNNVPQFVEKMIYDIVRVTDMLEVSDIFVSEKAKASLTEESLGQYKWSTLNSEQKKQAINEFMNENFRNSTYLNEETQLKYLYQIKLKTLDFFQRIAKKEHSIITKSFGSWFSLTEWKNWYYTSEQTNNEKELFTPIDVQIMRDIRDNYKDDKTLITYCFENKKNPLIEDDKLQITGPIFCLSNGLASIEKPKNIFTELGGKSNRKITKKTRKNTTKTLKKYKTKYYNR
jgi:hypothetical protein